MDQLIETLNARPMIIVTLISWPILLFILKVVSQKIMAKYEAKK